MKKIVLSGVQTTGHLHLGNYLGAITNWIKMQENYDCYFFLADLHAITVDTDPVELKTSTNNLIATYLASGIDPKKSAIFIQSSVKEHCEMAWMLNCITPIGWLKRMTQFKDKAGKKQDNASSGLFTYPVLMAADILLYDADYVPVGEDQKQHLELTRDIAAAANRKFNTEIFKLPEPLIQKTVKRIMSLRNGTEKMSKSNLSDASRINLSDDVDIIRQKIKKAKTDSIEYVSFDAENRPEISNLINIFSAVTEKTKEEIVQNYSDKNFVQFKTDLAEAVIEKLKPFSLEYNKLVNDTDYLKQVALEGQEKASIAARKKCNQLMNLFGLNSNKA